MDQLNHFANKVLQYEDPAKLDAALNTLPLEKLLSEAEAMVDTHPDLAEEDRLVKATLIWFKSWFKWVNEPTCQHCKFEKTEGPGMAEPSAEDRKYGAGVVELWNCPQCSGTTRFPRYNDPVKLLETRQGRCGEWCNAMHLVLRSLGRDTRFVWNSEDHVWNEIWSAKENRWIHIDSCEAAFDTPLIYADGWGKKMAYVIGFSVGGVRDITARYVRRVSTALPRTIFNETQLQAAIEALTTTMRNALHPVEVVEWYERDEAETLELAAYLNTQATPTQELPARQSGSAEWVTSRGEAGRS